MVSVALMPTPIKLTSREINYYDNSVCEESYLPFEEVWKGEYCCSILVQFKQNIFIYKQI